ncbi:major strawberry allergen Fra a 1-2-like [Impatiens glandulifera]|uniref:major strawberry allergen Fra a 1-2-like n=1 Tax=Impatiens glandulifera TaxID=253017 RepID=UPI001FB0F867|nr:major strawberry allergen Fra a 1-2-like [Impatiens glandulifera]
MGVTTYDVEIVSSISPAKLFKAFVLDVDNLVPKIMPQAIKSIETIEGNGGPGTVKIITFGEGSQIQSVKHRVDGIDKENYTYSYSIIEGDVLKNGLESLSYEIKISEGSNGGSVCKNTSKYVSKGDVVLSEEEIKEGKEKSSAIYKAIEAYLLANPDY